MEIEIQHEPFSIHKQPAKLPNRIIVVRLSMEEAEELIVGIPKYALDDAPEILRQKITAALKAINLADKGKGEK
ncbi:TPA: hypothetical protein HA278_00980 [Candidatus Woesearchaeota archaeon]|nr:hypothetical protein [Candidatus Woesearchaeota archaeon]|tara:strand:- start:326 stop:547 length:222 start_codon:yes stop_codon:yes gene_type:complete